MNNFKLLATASSLERVKALVSAYFYGSTVKLHEYISPKGRTYWTIETGSGAIGGYFIRKLGKRYRFEQGVY